MAKFRNGDRVVVPWGLNEVEGTVIDVFGPPVDPFVMVRVDRPGEDDVIPRSTEIGYKAHMLRPATAASRG